jgi:hypothetical protein
MGPVVYWLVLFSIVVHGLSIPGLNLLYGYYDVQPISEDAVEVRRKSLNIATPSNAMIEDEEKFIAYNRFSRPVYNVADLPKVRSRRQSMATERSRRRSMSRSRLSVSGRSYSGDRGRDGGPFSFPDKDPYQMNELSHSRSAEEGRAPPQLRERTIQYAQ